MQIEALKVFCDLAETKSFTKAAQLNQVTQSAVSQSVSALERQFNSLLVERSKRNFRLTPEGQMLYDCSKGILSTYNELFGKLAETKDTISGNIRVAAVYSIGLYDLPAYLKIFMKANPTVNVHVEYRRAAQVYEDVLSNVVDLGLVAYPRRQYNLEIVPLGKEPLVLICSPSHPLANHSSVKLKELHGKQFVHFAPDTPTRRAIERSLAEARAVVQPAMEFENIETVKRAVEINAGVAIVPKTTVALEVSNKTLAEVPLEGKGLFRPLGAIHKANKELSLAVKQFLGVLKGERTKSGSRNRMPCSFSSSLLCLCGSALVSLSFPGQAPSAAASPAEKSRVEHQRFALSHEGNPLRGKELFANEQRLACSKCHAVDGKGGKAGPDLFAVGDKYGRREIIDSVLTPSAIIAEGYNATIVETKSGEEYQGILKQVTDTAIELMGADGKPVRIPTVEIQEQRTSEVSLMPEGLEAGLTLEEFTDLIDYLVSLKQPENLDRVHHGMPNVIPSIAQPVRLRPFHDEQLQFAHPVWFGQPPGVSNVFMVVEHETGKIWRLDRSRSGVVKTVFVDLESFQKGTRGLLGMVFHPKFFQNGKYYFAKHIVENGKFATLIGEREAAPDLKTDSGRPTRWLLRLNAASGVHYGGGLQFGPDGFLYIGMGDTGPQEDPQGHGQDTTLLLGKMLRIDVDHPEAGRAYSIPSDNPFVGQPEVRPEIWALGFREPWRFSFDSLTHELWVGDVGQDRYEEVDVVRRGENYGWNVYEGFERFSNRYRKEGLTYIPPVFAYTRKFGVSVTGGFVCRAHPQSSFYGVYICGDYESRRIFGLTEENRTLKSVRQIGTSPQRIVSFGRSQAGDLYLVGYEGTIYEIDFDNAVFE